MTAARTAVALPPMPKPADLLIAAACGLSYVAWCDAGRPEPGSRLPRAESREPRASRPWAPYRSKWELEYATHLELLRVAGRLNAWAYEPDRLEIGEGARYTPDFRVTLLSGAIEYHEVKGYRRESAMVRIRVAAKLYPQCRFVLVTKANGSWTISPIKRAA